MEFAGSLNANVEIDIGADFKVDKKLESMVQAKSNIESQTKTVVVQRTTEVQDKSNEYLVQIEKYKKDISSLRNQLVQVQKVLGTQTKEINQLRQSKAAELQVMTTTIKTTSTTKTDDVKFTELQSKINIFIEANKKDEALISSQKLIIDQQNMKIHSLEATISQNSEDFSRQLAAANERYAVLSAQMESSSGADVDDKKRILTLNEEMTTLKEKIAEYESKITDREKAIEDMKLDLTQEQEKCSGVAKERDEFEIKFTGLQTSFTELESKFNNKCTALQTSEDEVTSIKAECDKKDKTIKTLKERIAELEGRSQTTSESSQSILIKKAAAEEALRKSELKFKELSMQFQDRCRICEILNTKVGAIEPLNHKLQDRILELEAQYKLTKEKLDKELAQDVEEQKTITDLQERLSKKMAEFEQIKMGDAAEHSKFESLSMEMTTTFTTQLNQWKLKSEENSKLIEERDAIILQKTEIIDKLKKLIAGLKNELDMAHSLSLQFKITKTETEQIQEKVSESAQIQIEAGKASIEVNKESQEVNKESQEVVQVQVQKVANAADAADLKYSSLKAEYDKMAEDFGRLRGEAEAAKLKMVAMSTELQSVQTEKMAIKAECESFKASASKSSEVEKSVLKCAEEQVSTYHDEINDAYNSIAATFGEIESELA